MAEPEDVLICVPVAWDAESVTGSIIEHCADCGIEIWQTEVPTPHGVASLCAPCAFMRARDAGDLGIADMIAKVIAFWWTG